MYTKLQGSLSHCGNFELIIQAVSQLTRMEGYYEHNNAIN